MARAQVSEHEDVSWMLPQVWATTAVNAGMSTTFALRQPGRVSAHDTVIDGVDSSEHVQHAGSAQPRLSE